MMEHKDKTDCFAYKCVPIKGGSSKARCEALKKLECRNSKCNWYEPMEAYQKRMEKQRQQQARGGEASGANDTGALGAVQEQ